MPVNRADEDDEEGPPPGVPTLLLKAALPYQTYEMVRHQRLTSFYLSKTVDDPAQYTDMIHRIRTAQPQDIITLHLNTPGGRLDTGIQIINAIKDSEAHIIAILDAKAYSLGTLLFLAADEFVIHDNTQFMIHNYSGGTAGKGNEQVAELNATVSWFKKLAKKYYVPFLTEAELEGVLNGKDMWMDSDEVRKRLKNMVKLHNEAQEAKEKEPKAKKGAAASVTVAELTAELAEEAKAAEKPAKPAKPTGRRPAKAKP